MRAALPVFAALLACACGTTPKESFYTLNPVPMPVVTARAGPVRYRVAVGPVRVPETVDRPQLVVRLSPNRVEVLESHRWAQPLRAEIARVLAADLESRLRDAQVLANTDYAATGADYRIAIDILRFEATPGQDVVVQAAWTVRRAAQTVYAGRSSLREPAHSTGYEALAAAYARALAAMSGELAAALQALPAERTTGP